MSDKQTLLFLCTGNSCRSQMAEGYARALAGDVLEVMSAGIEAHGQNPRAIAVMAEDGVDIAGQESTRLSDDMLARADVLVTVCGDADERCPMVPAGVEKRHWPIPDPARTRGTEAEILTEFRAVRDAIKRQVNGLVKDLAKAPDTGADARPSSTRDTLRTPRRPGY